MLGVPPFLVGLPRRRLDDVLERERLFDYHWRDGLQPDGRQRSWPACPSGCCPAGTTVEVNKDAYVQPTPYERAQTYEILNRIVDADGNPVLSVAADPAGGTVDERDTPGGPVRSNERREQAQPPGVLRVPAGTDSSASVSRNAPSSSS